jgi:dienelactone hydrolase
VGPLNIVRLRFTDAEGDVVPALLCTPRGKKGPFPLVVAVHGLTSNKAQVCAQVGPALAQRGFAILAADMPCHGERPGNPYSVMDHSHVARAFALGRQAINDVRQCIDLAESRPELDISRGVTLIGYSMGSWINCVAGPSDPRVRAMVLMVGGAVDIPRTALLIPHIAATDSAACPGPLCRAATPFAQRQKRPARRARNGQATLRGRPAAKAAGVVRLRTPSHAAGI